MKKCIVIGSGFAGLAAAVYLSEAGFNVEIIEASQKPGGRAYSFKEKKYGTNIDNGQHILMGCYYNTVEFYKKIGASGNLSFQKNLEVNFLRENFNLYKLKSAGRFYPLNLLIGMLSYRAMSVFERINMIKFFTKLYLYDNPKLNSLTVREWLEREGQSANSLESFWKILTVGAMNTSMDKASAGIFSYILKKMFFAGNKAASIVIPKTGLSESYTDNALEYIRKKGGEIKFGETVKSFETHCDKITAVLTQTRKITGFDYVVSSVPVHALEKMNPVPVKLDPLQLEYSCIVSIHVWLYENNLSGKFYGLIGSQVHWVFNHDDHITLVISDANHLAEKPPQEIFETVSIELKKYLNISTDSIKDYKVIKEKRATFVPSNEAVENRPESETRLSNFYLAGDWTQTRLPATIEGAVLSGKTAANLIKNSEKKR